MTHKYRPTRSGKCETCGRARSVPSHNVASDSTGYAPQGYYDPIETEAGIVDHDDPRPKGDTMTTRTFAASFEDELRDIWGDEYDETLADLARGGADAGFPGLTYYSDTVALYDEFSEEIWEALYEDANDMGVAHPIDLIATFGGAKNVGSDAQFKNLMVWYMAERIAHRAE